MKLFLSITYKKTREIFNNDQFFKSFNYRIFSEDSSFNKYFETKNQVKIYLDVLNKKLGCRSDEEFRIRRFNDIPLMTFNLIDK